MGISGPSLSASYVYDYEGKRIKRTVGGVQTVSLYQAEDIVKETSGGTVTNYLHGIGIDDPVLLDRGGAKSYYYSDGLGSIREVADSGGTVQNSYAYGAWGEVRAQSVTIPNIYGYTGREFAEEGLYYYRARYLDPRLGRFVAEDPMRFNGGMNFYVYVGNHPSEFSDPYGLQGCGIVEREGPNIRIGEPFTRTRWFGYWRALLACSVWKAAIISTGAFELPGKYPELCEFTIVYYEYWRYDSSTDLFFECEDACGEVEYSIFLDNEPAGKPWDVLKRTWEETAYVLDYVPFWKGKGKERFFRKF